MNWAGFQGRIQLSNLYKSLRLPGAVEQFRSDTEHTLNTLNTLKRVTANDIIRKHSTSLALTRHGRFAARKHSQCATGPATGYPAMDRLPQLQAARTDNRAGTERAQGKHDVSHVLASAQLQALVGADLLVLQQLPRKGGHAEVRQGNYCFELRLRERCG